MTVLTGIITVQCSRCHRMIKGLQDDNCTGGFYDTSHGYWQKYCDPDETIICDDCMHWDRRYVKDYGDIKGISRKGLTHVKFVIPYFFMEQWKEFLKHYPDAYYTPTTSSTFDVKRDNISFEVSFAMITYTDKKIPEGWNKKEARIRFLVPLGYPVSKPGNFWVDTDFRLINPEYNFLMYSSMIPDIFDNPGLWMKWYLQKWNPNRDTLLTYSRSIRQRLNILR
jgi:hypothetical protein